MSMSRPKRGIKAIELRMGSFIVYPTLLWDERHLVLVDTGIPGQLDKIRVLLEREGFGLDELTHVIITHQDSDHIGSLRSSFGKGKRVDGART